MSKTRVFRLNKLVRDRIVEHTFGHGGEVDYQKLSPEKRVAALVTKLIEEAQELEDKKLSISELADLKEIIEQIAKELKVDGKELKRLQAKKRRDNGGFTKGHFIKTLTLPADNRWAQYYASDPKRFKEIK